ncbi:MAG: hypothetical protein AAGE52_13940 [Myxococcota bacterium]
MTKAAWSGLCVLALIAGCGDDGGGGGGGGGSVDLGVDRSRTVSSITDDEAMDACIASQSATVSISDRAQCTLAGLTQTTQEACEMVRDACLEMGPEPVPDPEINCDDASAMDFADCDATVGMAEDCLNDQLDETEDALESLSCADVGSFPSPASPASCMTLESMCPDLFN